MPVLQTGGCRFKSYSGYHAACPGGEGAVLKTVGGKTFAGSNPVCSAKISVSSNGRTTVSKIVYLGSNPRAGANVVVV